MATKTTKNATRVSKVTASELKQYDDEKRIVLFFNEEPETSEDDNDNKKRPMMRGNITIDGKKYWISLWPQLSKDEEVYLQGQAQPAQVDKTSSNEIKNLIKEKMLAKL